MKKKISFAIMLLTIGIVIGSFVGCSNGNKVQADEDGYLHYCGTQNNIMGDKSVAVYEDTIHHKVIYIGSDGFQHPITVAVSDLGK